MIELPHNNQLLKPVQLQFNDSILAYIKRLEHKMDEFQNEIDRMDKALEKKGYL